MKMDKCSDRRMEVKLTALSGNYDRQRDQPIKESALENDRRFKMAQLRAGVWTKRVTMSYFFHSTLAQLVV